MQVNYLNDVYVNQKYLQRCRQRAEDRMREVEGDRSRSVPLYASWNEQKQGL